MLQSRSPNLWTAFLVLGMLTIAAAFFVPWLIENEMVYLIDGRQLIDSGFLGTDWTHAPAGLPRSLTFAPLTAALWWISSDVLSVALLARLIVWGVFLLALRRLAQTLSIAPLVTLIGLLAYVSTGQSIACGEWILGGAEQKVLAYSFFLLALTEMMQHRPKKAGLFIGLAALSHILVGGYGFGGLLLAGLTLVAKKHWRLRQLAEFAGIASLLVLPALILAATQEGLLHSNPIGSGTVDAGRMSVEFRNPHHLDPAFFLDWWEVMIAVCMLAAIAWALRTRPPSTGSASHSWIIGAALAGFSITFAFGIGLRAIDWIAPLRFYPFRVLDTVAPLLFWLLITDRAVTLSARFRRLRWSPWIAALALGGLTAKSAGTTIYHWYWFTEGADYTERKSAKLALWIQENTESTAVFVTDPFWKSFQITTGRPSIVTWKSAPVDQEISLWLKRLTLLNNGQKITERGAAVGTSLAKNFRSISVTRLKTLRDTHSGKFYLIDTERKDLAQYQVYGDGRHWVYDLQPL